LVFLARQLSQTDGVDVVGGQSGALRNGEVMKPQVLAVTPVQPANCFVSSAALIGY
jgi:hypothetical protein